MYLTLISTKRELFKGDGAETVLQMEMRVQFTLKLRVPLSSVIATRMEASTFPNGNPLISSGNPGTSISSPFFYPGRPIKSKLRNWHGDVSTHGIIPCVKVHSHCDILATEGNWTRDLVAVVRRGVTFDRKRKIGHQFETTFVLPTCEKKISWLWIINDN